MTNNLFSSKSTSEQFIYREVKILDKKQPRSQGQKIAFSTLLLRGTTGLESVVSHICKLVCCPLHRKKIIDKYTQKL